MFCPACPFPLLGSPAIPWPTTTSKSLHLIPRGHLSCICVYPCPVFLFLACICGIGANSHACGCTPLFRCAWMWRPQADIFLHCSPLYILGQGLSLGSRAHQFSSLGTRMLQGSCFCLLFAGFPGRLLHPPSIYIGAGNSQDHHTCTASPLPAEPPPLPCYPVFLGGHQSSY